MMPVISLSADSLLTISEDEPVGRRRERSGRCPVSEAPRSANESRPPPPRLARHRGADRTPRINRKTKTDSACAESRRKCCARVTLAAKRANCPEPGRFSFSVPHLRRAALSSACHPARVARRQTSKRRIDALTRVFPMSGELSSTSRSDRAARPRPALPLLALPCQPGRPATHRQQRRPAHAAPRP
jgi:hypothetical protein